MPDTATDQGGIDEPVNAPMSQLNRIHQAALLDWPASLAQDAQWPAALAQWIETVEQICASLTSPEENHGPGA